MFGLLKEKLKKWVGKSEEELETKAKPKKKAKKAAKKDEKKAKPEVKKKEVIEEPAKETIEEPTEEEIEPSDTSPEEEPEKKGFFSKLKTSLSYKVNEDDFSSIFDDLELLLLENNVAFEVVDEIKKKLEQELIGKEIKKQDIGKEIKLSLKKALEEIIIDPDDIIETIKQNKGSGEPFKVLFFGINGAGKTTSIAKFTSLLKKEGLTCALAAADTFRAASLEQLQIHADRLGVKMIKHDYGSDPSAVAFDAIKYAKEQGLDVVLIDTAGRMHTKDDLLREMEKICRVSDPDLKIFVAEAIAGNDATEQARAFNDMINIDGSILSKTDVDEKGGTIISISHVTNKPIFYLGTGQEYSDLELFNKQKFIKQLGLED